MTEHISVEQYHLLRSMRGKKGKKGNKFGAEGGHYCLDCHYQLLEKPKKGRVPPCPLCGGQVRWFASKAEHAYYVNLKLREKAGEVEKIELQKKFPLYVLEMWIADYLADFAYYDKVEKRHRIIDVKGLDTDLSAMKRKLVKAIYNVDVELAR